MTKPHQHDRPQVAAARRHAAPLLSPASGLPLIRSTPSLGKRLEWITGVSTVDDDMPDEARKKHVYYDFLVLKKWIEDEEDGEYVEGSVKVDGPYPHFEPQMNGVQVGDRGATRPIGHKIDEHVGNNGREDYKIRALFKVREYINEIPTDLAVDIFGKGRDDLKPLRQDEWKRTGSNSWSPK